MLAAGYGCTAPAVVGALLAAVGLGVMAVSRAVERAGPGRAMGGPAPGR